jgi:pyridoxine 5-phosphate synthase
MIRLSVNVNKVATLRNSRGGHEPSVIEAVRVVVAEGAPGITVHPRADERHITPADVRDIADVPATAARPRRVQHRR